VIEVPRGDARWIFPLDEKLIAVQRILHYRLPATPGE
jgi:hypothetical protein